MARANNGPRGRCLRNPPGFSEMTGAIGFDDSDDFTKLFRALIRLYSPDDSHGESGVAITRAAERDRIDHGFRNGCAGPGGRAGCVTSTPAPDGAERQWNRAISPCEAVRG